MAINNSPEINSTHRGNKSLKATDVQIEWTAELIAEWKKCSEDVVYFSENYIKIVNADEGIMDFKPYDYQKKMLRTYVQNRFNVTLASRQSGKALPLDENILTTNGFIKFGDLKIGDRVYGQDGKETKVTFITETMYNHDCYDISFDDGTIIKCDADHLWKVGSCRWKEQRVVNTKELIDILNKNRSHKQGTYIEMQKPLEMSPKELPIDPYTLGVWLGDGTSAAGHITCHKDDMPCYTNSIPYEVKSVLYDTRNTNVARVNFLGLNKLLRLNGLKNNKHIPADYKLSSIEQRLALMQGLMDTDGYVSEKGGMEFYQKNEELIDDVFYLLKSLGIKPRKRHKVVNGEIYWILSFSTNKPMFRLERKRERQISHAYTSVNDKLFIQDIKRSDSVPVRCIQVDNKDHMFLIGKQLIPTHNTTTFTAFILWSILFQCDYTVVLMANKHDTAKEIMRRVQFAFTHLPKWLSQGVVSQNKFTLELENNSRVIAAATTGDNVSGFTVNCLIIDECAKIQRWEEFQSSAFPTITSGKTTKVILVSSAKGLNHFHKIWTDSIRGHNNYARNKVMWYDVPGRDEEWRKNALQNECGNDPSRFDQEYGCQFLGSSGTLISGRVLEALGNAYRIPIHEHEGLRVYFPVEEDRKYFMTVDPAEGKDQDNSAFSIFDVSEMPYKQVAVFNNNKIQLPDFTVLVHHLAKHYNDALLMIETNLFGMEMCNVLWDVYEYTNQVLTEKGGAGSGLIMSNGFGGPTTVKGIRTSSAVKSKGCSLLKALVENGKLQIFDHRTVEELNTFSKKTENSKTYEAEKGNFDDIVASLWLFSWATGQKVFDEYCSIDNFFALRKHSERAMTERLVPFAYLGYQDLEDEPMGEFSVGVPWFFPNSMG